MPTSMICKLILFVSFMVLPFNAFAWELDSMNRTIDTTNFIVENKCSGTLIDIDRKIIITNRHCVSHLIKEVTETERGSDGVVKEFKRIDYMPATVMQNAYSENFDKVGSSQYVTEIIAEDENTDLAILRIKAAEIPHAFSSMMLPENVDVVRGERVYIVGNPRMLDASIVEGIISSINRKIKINNIEIGYLQFSGGITGGNSGGALYNDNGYFIGIPAAGSARSNFLGFAIPVWTIREFLADNCLAAIYGGDAAADKECVSNKDSS